jgi:hypothetical protein
MNQAGFARLNLKAILPAIFCVIKRKINTLRERNWPQTCHICFILQNIKLSGGRVDWAEPGSCKTRAGGAPCSRK